MLNNMSNMTSMANTASMNTVISSIDVKKSWIIDTWATNHMIVDPDLLINYIKLDYTKPRRVFFAYWRCILCYSYWQKSAYCRI